MLRGRWSRGRSRTPVASAQLRAAPSAAARRTIRPSEARPRQRSGETHCTHAANLQSLTAILHAGLLCHRTNHRLARAFPGTPLAALGELEPLPSAEHFATWKADVDHIWDQFMKQRVYPTGLRVPGLHSSFIG
ncbi:hypothetical protein [Streptomyces sp. RPA4-5]|uniref:hypothetical protein n=1 Tax=Streptomyces sp. RPA4-5 TaxID=2721245 RepID=UPI002001DB87|nr:hypothetical protein [Streptomyces sp. RPA4-5]